MAENQKPPRKPNYAFTAIACAYLIYLGGKLAVQVYKDGIAATPNAWLFILGSVVFVVFGIFFGIRTVKLIVAQRQADREATAKEYAEEQAKLAENGGDAPAEDAAKGDGEDE